MNETVKVTAVVSRPGAAQETYITVTGYDVVEIVKNIKAAIAELDSKEASG